MGESGGNLAIFWAMWNVILLGAGMGEIWGSEGSKKLGRFVNEPATGDWSFLGFIFAINTPYILAKMSILAIIKQF